jgi:hypothetical protein
MKPIFKLESATESERISSADAQELLNWIERGRGRWELIPVAYEMILKGVPVSVVIARFS